MTASASPKITAVLKHLWFYFTLQFGAKRRVSEFKNSTLFGVTDVNHIVDFIPYEKHDISMDALITHDEIIEINL